MKLMVFLDSEELEYGDFFPTTLEAAMRSAPLHIAIFSENYAKSSWCLAELSYMLKVGAKIIPVFYHVEPKAFKGHEQKGRYSLEQLEEWKRALYNISFYNGQIIRTNDDEMRLLKNIVNCALKQITNVPLVVAKHPVGLKEIVQDFEVNTLQSAQGDQLVQIVGICGMGGSGKTTLAKELYNKISSSMVRSSIVFEVRDAAAKGLLHEKQKNDLGIKGKAFYNIEEGMGNLSRCLTSVRVLIVLDDVDNVEQLDALLPAKDNLERDETFPAMVEKVGEIDDSHISCSNGNLMVNTNRGIWSLAPSLVGLKIFVTSGNYFNQVIGQVSGELIWLRWFQIGQRNLPSGLVWKKLRVLELYEDWISSAEHHIEELWGETESEAPMQLRELRVSGCYKFQRFPKSIGRLNHLEKIVIIKGYNDTTLPDEFCLLPSLEHLVLYQCEMLSSLPSNFGNLRNLRHLNLSCCAKLRRLPDSFKSLMLLEYLNLEQCSQLTFTLDDLNILENMTNLGFLSVSKCKQLKELPFHITNQVFLRELYLEGTSLRKLPVNICELSGLRKIRIGSLLLTSLPTSLADLSFLTDLSIEGCPQLERLPDSLGGLSSLTNLSIQGCSEVEYLPDSLKELSSLTNLSISRCHKLECLPASLGNLTSLMYLSIQNCRKLDRLPDSLEVDNCWEVPCIESLKDMEKLRQVNLRANKGSAIVGCIQTIQKWPDEIQICMRAVPDASSLIDSVLFQNFLVVESFSDQKIQSRPKLVHKCSSDGHAFLFCFVIVCVASKMRLRMHGRDSRGEVSNRLSKLEKGRWVWIGVFSQRSMDFLFPSDELSIDGGD
ncbi:hypothetical protein SUGI_0285410 [Cryptomeria japonica]|nr:hypothetical protein SUGI_0285410 [Cryptomeria japonica]